MTILNQNDFNTPSFEVCDPDNSMIELRWHVLEYIVSEITENVGFYYIVEQKMSAHQVFDFFSNDLRPIFESETFTEEDYRFCIFETRRNSFH